MSDDAADLPQGTLNLLVLILIFEAPSPGPRHGPELALEAR